MSQYLFADLDHIYNVYTIVNDVLYEGFACFRSLCKNNNLRTMHRLNIHIKGLIGEQQWNTT